MPRDLPKSGLPSEALGSASVGVFVVLNPRNIVESVTSENPDPTTRPTTVIGATSSYTGFGNCAQLNPSGGAVGLLVGWDYNNSGAYQFEIVLNFQRNRWSALLSQTEIISLQPIRTTTTPLSLGDIDAVYYLRDPAKPGDNYMLFDNYTVTAEGIANTAPFLQPTSRLACQVEVHADLVVEIPPMNRNLVSEGKH